MSIADFIINGWGWACVFAAGMWYGIYANCKWIKLTRQAWEIADKWQKLAVDRGDIILDLRKDLEAERLSKSGLN